MKVLGLCCGRKNGNTELLMAEALKGVLEIDPNAEVSFINLHDAEIEPCIGCETCMNKKIEGDYEFRCVHGIDKDNFHDIEMEMRAADGIIVSAPAYNLLPPGIMIKFLNKLHASGDYRKITQGVDICKVGACFSIGGTDWTDYMPNIMREITMELVGVYNGVIDCEHFDFQTAFQAVLIDPEVLERVHQMGVNVANAINYKKETGKNADYVGMEGFCPYCHSNLLRVNPDGTTYCPQCNIEGTVEVVDGKLKVSFTQEALDKSRWGVYGQKLHIDNIAKMHAKAGMNMGTIKESFNNNYKDLVAKFKQPITKK